MFFSMTASTDSFEHLLAIISTVRETVAIRKISSNGKAFSDNITIDDEYKSRYAFFVGSHDAKEKD